MRSLLRRYPDFPDVRAALAAALWGIGKEGDAETEWRRVEDGRWVRGDTGGGSGVRCVLGFCGSGRTVFVNQLFPSVVCCLPVVKERLLSIV